MFIRGERVYFSDLWGKGIIEINLVVIGSGGRNMVGGFLREHQGEQGIFRGESGFWFKFLGCGSEFSGSGEFGNDQGSCWDKVRSTLDDSVDSMVLSGMTDVFILGFPIIIHKEVLVSDCVNIGVMQRFD